MTVKPLFPFLCLLMACAGSAPAWSAANTQLQVRDGYVRGLPPGSANTSAYMILVNNSNEDLVLIGANTAAANSVMIHNSVRQADGMMTMEHVMSATIPARGQLALKTGGMHLMLMGLKKPLRDGNSVNLTLQFAGGFVHNIDLPVVSVLNE